MFELIGFSLNDLKIRLQAAPRNIRHFRNRVISLQLRKNVLFCFSKNFCESCKKSCLKGITVVVVVVVAVAVAVVVAVAAAIVVVVVVVVVVIVVDVVAVVAYVFLATWRQS